MKSIHKTTALCLLLIFGVTFVVVGVTTDTEETLLPSLGAEVVTIGEYIPIIDVFVDLDDRVFLPEDPNDDGSGFHNWPIHWDDWT